MIAEDLSAYLRPTPDREPAFSATHGTMTAAAPKPPTADEMMATIREMAALLPPAPPTSGLLGFDSITRRSVGPSASFRIVEDGNMTDTVEDWSEVRSRSRAARRRRQGHRQRIRYAVKPKREIYRVGDMLVMHPEVAREFRAKVAAAGDDMVKRAERELFGAMLGFPARPLNTAEQEA